MTGLSSELSVLVEQVDGDPTGLYSPELSVLVEQVIVLT